MFTPLKIRGRIEDEIEKLEFTTLHIYRPGLL